MLEFQFFSLSSSGLEIEEICNLDANKEEFKISIFLQIIHKNAVANSFEALLKSCKKIENLEKNTEIPEIIREYVTLNTSTDNLAL